MAVDQARPNQTQQVRKERKKAERKDPATRFGLATFSQLRPAMQMATEKMKEGEIPPAELVQAAGQLNAAIAAWCAKE